MPPRVLGILTDFMFKAKLSAVAAHTGASLRFAGSVKDAEALAGELAPELVLVDLHAVHAWESVPAVRAVAPEARLVGFYSHVDAATRERALTAGVEPMPRSRFVEALPSLLS